MKIKLDSHYSIEADNIQWILLKDDRPNWFFKMRKSKSQDIEQLLNYQKRITTRLTQVLDKVSGKDLATKLPIRRRFCDNE